MCDGSDAAPIRVLVVDDHRVVREGLRAYLAFVDDIEMVGEASDGRDALDWLARAKSEDALPDVVLMDLLMEPMDGITATASIKERHPAVEVVAIHEDRVKFLSTQDFLARTDPVADLNLD